MWVGDIKMKNENGHFAGAVAITTGFADGAGQIWLDNVQCVGMESRLINCPANALGTTSCGHVSDAGVSEVLSHNGDLHSRSHQTAGRHCHSGTCGDLQQQCVGDSV